MLKYRQLDPDHPIHFVTINVEHNLELLHPEGPRAVKSPRQRCDCMNAQPYCDIAINALNFYRQQLGLRIFGYVLMPTHLHGLFLPEQPDEMNALIGDGKTWTTKKIIALLRAEGYHQIADRFRWREPRRRQWLYHLWEFRACDMDVWTKAVFEQKLRYIHENPIRWGLCELPEQYRYSSFRSLYMGDHSVMEVDIPEW